MANLKPLKMQKRLPLFSFPHTFLFLTFLFIFIFPKGGIKIGQMPVTWGYVLLLTFACLINLVQKKCVFSQKNLTLLFALLPFQIVSLFCLFLHGIDSFGFTVSFILSFFLLPWVILGSLSTTFDVLNLEKILLWIKNALFLVALFGLLQFFLRLLTEKSLHIPFLTLNFSDIDTVETAKCNNRGFWIKLYATFQNGNLYGIATSLFLPLFYFLEKSWWKKNLVILALLLTLSRTVWIGILVHEMLQYLYIHKITARSFLTLFLKLSGYIGIAYAILIQIRHAPSFLVDPTLGGRIETFESVDSWSFLGYDIPFPGIGEVTYIEILKYFGLLGLMTFLIGMLAPLWLFFTQIPLKRQTSLQKALASGLILYLFISASDGALLLIPVMTFYWIATALLLKSIDEIPPVKA